MRGRAPHEIARDEKVSLNEWIIAIGRIFTTCTANSETFAMLGHNDDAVDKSSVLDHDAGDPIEVVQSSCRREVFGAVVDYQHMCLWIVVGGTEAWKVRSIHISHTYSQTALS